MLDEALADLSSRTTLQIRFLGLHESFLIHVGAWAMPEPLTRKPVRGSRLTLDDLTKSRLPALRRVARPLCRCDWAIIDFWGSRLICP